MFSFFKKKDPSVLVIDKITMDDEAKLAALQAAWQTSPELVILFWFEESLQQVTDYFSRNGSTMPELMMTREASSRQLQGKKIIFGEHYPLASREQVLYHELGLQAAEVYSSLHEPLFRQFGGDRIITLMQSLGMDKNEVIEHSMISNSIRRAQEKIGKKLKLEQPARSAQQWFAVNFSG